MQEETSVLRPLAGFRVLDLTNVLAGPFCCHQLAHLGAEVIKVEVPERGDLARQLGADAELNRRLMGVSFLAQNAGKKSVTLNLKAPRGKALFKDLVKTADVVVENFRPGVMDRLGVGWEALKAENPALVYCAISGFGQDGPLRDLPAYDQIIQGMSGVMSITGDRDTAPYRVGYPLCDTIGGLTAAMAIAAALNAPKESRGTFIDVSMLEATLATMGWVVSNWLVAGVRPQANGNENVTSAPSGAFRTADGLLNIAANKQEQWEILCRLLGRAELLERPEYATRADRIRHRYTLKADLEETLQTRGAMEWAAEMNAAGVPAGPVMAVPDVLEHPQVADRGMLGTFDHVPGADRPATLVRTGFKLDRTAPTVDTPPPQLGQDNETVWGGLGLKADEIASLRAEGVL